jgi:hypothetical protein
MRREHVPCKTTSAIKRARTITVSAYLPSLNSPRRDTAGSIMMFVDDAHLVAVDDADRHVCAVAVEMMIHNSRPSTANSEARRGSAIAKLGAN